MDQDTLEKNETQKVDAFVKQTIVEIQAKYAQRWAEIESEDSNVKQNEMRDKLTREIRDEILSKIRLPGSESVSGSEKGDKAEDLKERAKEVKKTILTVSEMKKNRVEVLDKTSQILTDSIAEKIKTGEISDQEAIDIVDYLGKQLVDGVVLSKEGQQESDFDKNLRLLDQKNHAAFEKIRKPLKDNAETFGTTAEEIDRKFGQSTPENQAEQQEAMRRLIEQQTNGQNDRDTQFTYDRQLYSRFTKDDQEFLHKLYKVETFKEDIVNEKINEIRANSLDQIEHRLKETYKEMGKPVPTGQEYIDLIDKQIKIEASQNIAERLVDIMNKLYWRVHIERPQKYFEEIEKEDFMTGIETTRMKIMNALENLQHSLSDEEKILQRQGKKPEFLYKQGGKDDYIDEKKYGIKGSEHVKPYMRTIPLPEFKDIELSGYVQYLITSLSHWRHRSEYLHNARAIFNHPAHGEEGFFGNLGSYAENLGGTDIDEMMMLPDGKIVYDAFVLYDKFVEEEFAANDWRHRPNQFTNSLEEVNTKVEKEVIERLQAMYGEKSIDEIRHAVNSAVGMARGVFMTETEKSAYADAVDPEGKGMFASYATNDATALMTFNPLHVMLRWQGEHMLPMFYFMNVEGSGARWDHTKIWNDASKYFESFLEGKAGLKGKNIFIDKLMDNLNVGGMMKRRSWRMTYSLDGHIIYDIDEQDSKSKKINHLETFKAMEAIGYEAIFDFLRTKLDKSLLKADGTIDDLFRHIFDRYFKPLGETNYEDYMEKLKEKGEEKAKEILKEKKTLSGANFKEEINLQTGLLFINNAIAREVAMRFPSKFLRIDRDRFTENGVSRYTQVQNELTWSRDKFNYVMKDFSFAEMLLRREITDSVKDASSLFPDLKLNSFTKYEYNLNKETIKRLLRDKGKLPDSRIKDVVEVWEKMQKKYLNAEFLDSKGFDVIDKYKFTFGIEDTDFTLMAMRATGPRMIARTIKDTAVMEKITPWITNMPRLLNIIATSGKHDFGPIIEYLQKAQGSITQVHATGEDFKYIYRIAAAAIQYFKKDTMAKPLFGLLRIGKRNSIAAEYAGRSSAVWEWDSRDIDRFCVALESLRLLPKTAFKMEKGQKYEARWINLFGKPVKFGQRKVQDYEWSANRLRKEFGGDLKAISFDMVNQFLPIALAFLLWKYIKDAMSEATGKKK